MVINFSQPFDDGSVVAIGVTQNDVNGTDSVRIYKGDVTVPTVTSVTLLHQMDLIKLVIPFPSQLTSQNQLISYIHIVGVTSTPNLIMEESCKLYIWFRLI